MGPIRGSLMGCNIDRVTAEDMPPIRLRDFEDALKQVRPSVAQKELTFYVEWNREFGSFQIPQVADEDGDAPAAAAPAAAPATATHG